MQTASNVQGEKFLTHLNCFSLQDLRLQSSGDTIIESNQKKRRLYQKAVAVQYSAMCDHPPSTCSVHAKGLNMGKISVSEGRVCIIKTDELTTVKEGLEQIKTAIIDCTAKGDKDQSAIETFLFIDLSLFNIINSSVIGVLGSVLMNPRVRMLGLCGVQPPVEDILKRFGVLDPEETNDFVAHKELKSNMSKVVTFETIEQGLGCLNPT